MAGGGSLSSLNLAVHYELLRPGGMEVDLPGFPAIEEMSLLGSGSLDTYGYREGQGIELLLSVPAERLAALAQARDTVAHNAALRLRIALDAIDRNGRVVPATSKSVTFTVVPGPG